MYYTSREVYEYIAQQSGDTIVEWRTCTIAGVEFPIFQSEVDLLQKLSPVIAWVIYNLPLPTLCPEERKRQRIAYRNLKTLYNDICDLTGKKIISRFHPDWGHIVYANDAWSSDKRDSKDYGLGYDSHRPVMDHINELLKKTPYQDLLGSLSNVANNSVYTNATADVKDCYLVFDAHDVEKSCYSQRISNSTLLFDCLWTENSERCYECINCDKLYECVYCTNTTASDHCYYMNYCHGCHFCIWCVNLVWKQYYCYNQQVTKEEYEMELERIRKTYFGINERFEQIKHQSFLPANIIEQSENSYWSNLHNCQNVKLSMTCGESNNLVYCSDIVEAQDCIDVDGYGHNSFLMYNSTQAGRYSNHLYCCAGVGKSEHLYYCVEVKKSHHCFGCVNMRDASYCIFNKQYTSQEREILVPQIINRMIADGTWGKFFSIDLSPFPYNDTDGQILFPITNERKNWSDYIIYTTSISGDIMKWEVYSSERKLFDTQRNIKQQEINIPEWAETIEAKDLPRDIAFVTDDIVTKVILCQTSWRPFRITSLELSFYRSMGLPLPYYHPDIRYMDRLSKKSQDILYLRSCDKTWEIMLSVYPQEYWDKIYSPSAYQREIFG